MNPFIEQLTFYFLLAAGICLFTIGFKPLFQVALAHISPLHGAVEAASA